MPPTWIADQAVVFVHADGRRSPGRIAIAQPEQVGPDEATCLIALDGLERTRSIHSASTLQALLLGIRFLGMRLHDFVSKGGRLVAPDGDTDFPLEAYFGDLLRPAEPTTDTSE